MDIQRKKMKANSLIRAYRIMNSLHRRKVPFFPNLIRLYIRVIYSCELHPMTPIGKKSTFAHNGLGVIVNKNAIIGENVTIFQNVTIGGRNGRGAPHIEDDVFIGPGACILGGITIGRGATIGANSVVINDVPKFSLVVTPLAEIKKNYENIVF